MQHPVTQRIKNGGGIVIYVKCHIEFEIITFGFVINNSDIEISVVLNKHLKVQPGSLV